MSEHWAKQRADVVAWPLKHRISASSYDALVERIAAELQRVADECVETVENAPMKGKLPDGDEFWRGQTNFAADIREKFPKEGM